jgi:regulator of RNase E activity RraB
MYPKIIDNQRRKLLDIFERFSGNYDEISIATGYWDLKGMGIVLPPEK